MARKATFPLRTKLLLAQMCILGTTLTLFVGLAAWTFIEDKKVSLRDYSLSLLESASGGFALQLRVRLESLERGLPLVTLNPATQTVDLRRVPGAFNKLLNEDLLRLTVFIDSPGGLKLGGEWDNEPALAKRKINSTEIAAIDTVPLKVPAAGNSAPSFQNRTPEAFASAANGIPILSVIVRFNAGSTSLIAVVDLDSTFLQRELSRAELAQIFLLNEDGSLLVHLDRAALAKYAKIPFPHPIIARFREVASQAENHEVEFQGEAVFASFGRTMVPGVFAVAQIPRAELFRALQDLLKTTGVAAGVLAYASFLVCAFLAKTLTQGLRKLQRAAELVSEGRFDFSVGIKARDEIALVAESFDEMTEKIQLLLDESSEKVRMEEELKTASLLQATILNTKSEGGSSELDFAFHYASATECSGDFWDSYVHGNVVTIAVADATGHGVSAAIVTAVAKSCLATMNNIYSATQLAPEHYMTQLNEVIYQACQGKLLMTMCLAQINLTDGTVLVANAGHEFPMCFRAQDADPAHPQRSVEELISRGERLGFLPGQTYESTTYQLQPGDTLLLYTDGIVENPNNDGVPWGDRQLRKSYGEAALKIAGDAKGAAHVRDRILAGYTEFVADAPPKDDVTFVLARWRPRKAA